MDGLPITALSLLACGIPTLIYAALIYWLDRYEQEPMWLLLTAFAWGAIPSIVLAVLLNSLLTPPIDLIINGRLGNMTNISVIAPIIEESLKGIMLFAIYRFWSQEVDTILDGIVYGATIGLGFGMVENFFYFTNEFATGGFEAWRINVFFRAIVFGFNHALFSSMFGIGIAAAILNRSSVIRFTTIVTGWVLAISLHAIHNTVVVLGGSLILVASIIDWTGVWVIVGIIVWSLREEQGWIAQYLKEEVALGTLTMRQYEIVNSRRLKSSLLWDLLTHHSFRRYQLNRHFFQLCSKLAYRKHYVLRHESEAESIMALRQQVSNLSYLI